MTPTDEKVKGILENSHRVAVLGASTTHAKPAHFVPAYLAEQGYEVLPVNPHAVGHDLFGRSAVGTLAELEGAVDVVDVFRRPEDIPAHLPDILAMTPLPKVVWFQEGIRNDEVAAELEAAGITVVQDRCMLAEHKRLLGGR